MCRAGAGLAFAGALWPFELPFPAGPALTEGVSAEVNWLGGRHVTTGSGDRRLGMRVLVIVETGEVPAGGDRRAGVDRWRRSEFGQRARNVIVRRMTQEIVCTWRVATSPRSTSRTLLRAVSGERNISTSSMLAAITACR